MVTPATPQSPNIQPPQAIAANPPVTMNSPVGTRPKAKTQSASFLNQSTSLPSPSMQDGGKKLIGA